MNNLRNQNYSSESIHYASREIAKIIGSRMDYVRRVLVGFRVYQAIEDEAYFRIRDLNDTTFHFNYIADSLNKANIVSFLGLDFTAEIPSANLDKANLKEWTKWLFEKNDQNRTRLIGTSSDLTMLNKVLGNESALVAFRKGAEINRAYELTEDLSELFAESIKKCIVSLEQADNIVHRLNDFYGDLDEDLLSIRKLTVKIKSAKDSAEDEKF